MVVTLSPRTGHSLPYVLLCGGGFVLSISALEVTSVTPSRAVPSCRYATDGLRLRQEIRLAFRGTSPVSRPSHLLSEHHRTRGDRILYARMTSINGEMGRGRTVEASRVSLAIYCDDTTQGCGFTC